MYRTYRHVQFTYIHTVLQSRYRFPSTSSRMNVFVPFTIICTTHLGIMSFNDLQTNRDVIAGVLVTS